MRFRLTLGSMTLNYHELLYVLIF